MWEAMIANKRFEKKKQNTSPQSSNKNRKLAFPASFPSLSRHSLFRRRIFSLLVGSDFFPEIPGATFFRESALDWPPI